jgi:PIN domain nuclease of toxin-antitoxin system
VNLLLDTHTLIWLLEGDDSLSSVARKQIENPSNTNFVSVASFWEIAIKVSLNKLVMQIFTENLKQFPFHHKDPLDRLLIAQAINQDMALVSKDEFMPLYPVQIIW